MKKHPILALASLIIVLILSGCASSPEASMVQENHSAGKNLINTAGREISHSENMIAATFSDINNLSRSSTFGRIASQQVVSAFSKEGFTFIDVLLRNNIDINENQGEFLLSREISEISTEYNAHVVLVGTYAKTGNKVFVTAKLIRTNDGAIIASHDYTVPYIRSLF